MSFAGLVPTWLALDQVDEGKDENPDQIDEVPEQSQDFDVVCVRLSSRRASERDEDVGRAGEHVRTMEAGGDIESVGISTMTKDQAFMHQPMVWDEAKVLVELPGEEPRPPQGGQRQKEHRLLPIAFGGGGDREHHRHARADKQESQKRSEGDPQRRFTRVMPYLRPTAQDPVGQQQSPERECVREEEDPHPNLPYGGASEILVNR